MSNNLIQTKYNIIQGAMATITLGAFAGEVSKHGALGTIASGGLNPQQLRSEIEIAQAITDNPIAVNLMLMSKHMEAFIDVIIEMKVPIITYSGGDITPFIEILDEHKITKIALVNTVEKAIKEAQNGADILIAEGTEAGGHVGNVSTMTLIPEVVDAVDIPVYAAGGIADKRGVNAALALGAVGVQVGTLFIASEEAKLPQAYKEAVLNATSTSTIVTGKKFGGGVRVLNNEMTKKYIEAEYSDATYDDLEAITQGSLRRSVVEGDMVTGSVMMGQVAGLIHEIDTIESIIDKLK